MVVAVDGSYSSPRVHALIRRQEGPACVATGVEPEPQICALVQNDHHSTKLMYTL